MKDQTLIYVGAGAALLYFLTRPAQAAPAVAPLSGSPFSQPAIGSRAVVGAPTQDTSGLSSLLSALAKGLNTAISGGGGAGSKAGTPKLPPFSPSSSGGSTTQPFQGDRTDLSEPGIADSGGVFAGEVTPENIYSNAGPYGDLAGFVAADTALATEGDTSQGSLDYSNYGSSDLAGSDYVGSSGDYTGGFSDFGSGADLSGIGDLGGGSGDTSLDSTD